MKRIPLMIGILLVLAGAVRAAEDIASGYRIFTSKDGRAIEGRIVEYDARKGEVQLERRGAGTVWVTPDVFDEADQVYIHDWIAASTFLIPHHLQPEAEKNSLARGGSRSLSAETLNYTVTVKNKSSQPLAGLSVEYKYFIDYKGKKSMPDSIRIESGSGELGDLEPNIKKEITTDPVVLESGYMFYETVRGLWIRLYGPKVAGEPLYRDFTFPEDLQEKVSWDQQSTPYSEVIRTRIKAGAISSRRRGSMIRDAVLLIMKTDDDKQLEDISLGLEHYYRIAPQSSALLPAPQTSELLPAVIGFREMGREDLYEKWLVLLLKDISPRNKQDYLYLPLISEMYSSSPDPKLRNGVEAEKYARRAMLVTQRESEHPLYHDLLARALARQEKFGEAEVEQQKAIEMLSKAPGKIHRYFMPTFKERLAGYQKKVAYVRGKDDVAMWAYYYYVDGELIFPRGKRQPVFLRTSWSVAYKPK